MKTKITRGELKKKCIQWALALHICIQEQKQKKPPKQAMAAGTEVPLFRCISNKALAVQLYPQCGIVNIELKEEHGFDAAEMPETCTILEIGDFSMEKKCFVGCTLLNDTIPKKKMNGRKKWLLYSRLQ